MARYCESCNEKLSWFAERFLNQTVCDECKQREAEESLDIFSIPQDLVEVKKQILASDMVSGSQLEAVKRHSKRDSIAFYSSVWHDYFENGVIGEQEIETLNKIQAGLELTKQEVQYDDRIIPYVYAVKINKESELPGVTLPLDVDGQVILRNNEIIHFTCGAVLKEMRTTDVRFEGGSQGVSIPVFEGINYGIGTTRGHIVREDNMVETSRGLFLVTNQRIFLHPSDDNKPISITLDKILSYKCFANGIQIYEEGREEGYFISLEKSSAVDVVGLCLGYLFSVRR